ncbi:MAG: hypothetical protein SGILL_006787 [Bacillariaceae sp.]
MTTPTQGDIEEKNAKALELLPALKEELKEDCNGVDDEYLLMFLRWKQDIGRASGRYRSFLKWKKDNPGVFDDSLRASKDDELARLLESEVIVTVPGLTTKQGGPLLIGRLRNNDMTDGRTVKGVSRMLYYTIDRTLMQQNAQDYGLTVLHDLRGFNRDKNARVEVAKAVFQALLGHFPIRVKAIYIWQAPWIFYPFFKIVSTMVMPKKIRDRVRFIDELTDIEDVVDPQSLLVELGGTLEWSAKDWVEDCKQQEMDGNFKSMTNIDPVAAKPEA